MTLQSQDHDAVKSVFVELEFEALGKRLFYRHLEVRIEGAYSLATDTITGNMLGPDAREGVVEFIVKRTPSCRHEPVH